MSYDDNDDRVAVCCRRNNYSSALASDVVFNTLVTQPRS